MTTFKSGQAQARLFPEVGQWTSGTSGTTVSAPGVSSMKILMVDDDPSLVKILSFLLRDEGYEVVTATTGTEALQVLQQEWVDMVILDVMLPRVDGFELCCRVRESNGVVIIMLSARGST